MKLVLTNDDGIDAPGLAALYQIVKPLGEIVVVAPSQPHSGVGHRVTTNKPLKVQPTRDHFFSVDGTPADCTRLALKVLAADADWLIAGINPGANLGSDVYNSGTVAAAREAAILGCPALAISQYIGRNCQIDWEVTQLHASALIRMLLTQHPGRGHFWNANLPHPLAADDDVTHTFCDLDILPHAYTYRPEPEGYVYQGIIHNRPSQPGRDVAICFGGQVSITRLAISSSNLSLTMK
jgi:5'/3'-nucleotidase